MICQLHRGALLGRYRLHPKLQRLLGKVRSQGQADGAVVEDPAFDTRYLFALSEDRLKALDTGAWGYGFPLKAQLVRERANILDPDVVDFAAS